MKRKIFLLMICLMMSKSVMALDNKLLDISGHWAEESIIRLYENQKIKGYSDNTFKPDQEITVLEFIKILMDSLNIELIEDGFNKWPNYYIATAKEYDLEYDYNKKLTRYEATDIIAKLIDLKSTTPSSNKFKDLKVKNKSDILKLTKLHIINGYDDNTFRGDNNLTRAEAVTIILRAVDANKTIISNKTYKIDSKYTNVNRSDAKCSQIDRIRYEIKDNKIYFYDTGRFSYLEDYTIKEKYITNKKLISIVEKLVSEDSYTALYYVPSDEIINQIIIKYGENDNYVNINFEYFAITYYEDKLYDLGRISLKDLFTHECFMKVSINKMWNDFYKFEKGEYVDEQVKNKLHSSLKLEFGKDTEKILDYMIEKYNSVANTRDLIVEQKQIGKYIINAYKTDATNLEFYFEKIS